MSDNKKAFPFYHEWETRSGSDCIMSEGMDLRDYFAAKALNGIMSGIYSDQESFRGFVDSLNSKDKEKTLSEMLTEQSYEMADAMLKARNIE